MSDLPANDSVATGSEPSQAPSTRAGLPPESADAIDSTAPAAEASDDARDGASDDARDGASEAGFGQPGPSEPGGDAVGPAAEALSAPVAAAKATAKVPEADEVDAVERRLTWIESRLNPLIYKDLLTFSRGVAGGGSATKIVAYAVFFALPILAFAWSLAFLPGPHRFAMRHVFIGLCALLAFFHLGVAVPASTAFALERDRDTLEGLIVSPLGPWRLVLGKLGTAMTVGLLAKGAVLPPLAVAYALGGGEVSFLPRYFALLLAVDLSLASLALYMGCRQRDTPTQFGWVKNQATQTQLALQATIGISVLSFLLPFYAIGFLIPLALQHGVVVAEVLNVIAPLGAFHPLAALAAWGDADLFGLSCPVWLLGTLFHLSLALPLLSGTADAQRTEGAPPKIHTRLLWLPAVCMTLLIASSVLIKAPLPVRTAVGLALGSFVLVLVSGITGFQEEAGTPVTLRSIVGGLNPLRALEGTPSRAPGYVFWVSALIAPFLLWVGQGGAAAFSSWLALTLIAVSLATLGARLAARVRESEDQAFLRALAGEEEEVDPDLSEEDQEQAEKSRRSAPRRYLGLLILLGFALPPLAGALAALITSGAVPGLSRASVLVAPLAGIGLALNPFTSALPVLADPRLLGTDMVQRALDSLGTPAWAVFIGHVAIYGTALCAALATLKPPLSLEDAVKESAAPSPKDTAAASEAAVPEAAATPG